MMYLIEIAKIIRYLNFISTQNMKYIVELLISRKLVSLYSIGRGYVVVSAVVMLT